MYEVVDWIQLARNMVRFEAVMDTKMNVLASIKGRAFFEQTSDYQFVKKMSPHMAHFLPQ
jgi:hypothetical protein